MYYIPWWAMLKAWMVSDGNAEYVTTVRALDMDHFFPKAISLQCIMLMAYYWAHNLPQDFIVCETHALLLKTPTLPGHENSHDITTQTPPDLKSNTVEAKPSSSTEQEVVTEQLGSLVEACVFTQAEDQMSWGESRTGVGMKEQHNDNFIAQSNALGSTTDIIVTCHPATLAAITGHNFITTSTADCSSIKLKPRTENPCGKDDRGEQQCLVMNSSSSESVLENKTVETVSQSNEQSSTNSNKSPSEQYIDIDGNKTGIEEVTVTELKPYITTSTTRSLTEQLSNTTLKTLGQEQMEPLILEVYEEEPNENGESKFSLNNSNVMHIVVASAEQQKVEEETNVETEEEGEENGTAIFICEVCERTFVTARSLEIHLSLKHRNKGQCDMCPLRFGSVQSLQDHCKTDHGGTGCFNCLVCSRRFMTKLSYKRHIDTHGGKKGAVCDMCGKTFSRTDYLQKHYMTHNGNRPFTCSHCPRKFISSSQLKVHEKTHSGVKEHVCDMCNKAFSRGDKLKDHMLRHLNIKRFQCSYCKRDYAEKRDLNKHLKTHMK